MLFQVSTVVLLCQGSWPEVDLEASMSMIEACLTEENIRKLLVIDSWPMVIDDAPEGLGDPLTGFNPEILAVTMVGLHLKEHKSLHLMRCVQLHVYVEYIFVYHQMSSH